MSKADMALLVLVALFAVTVLLPVYIIKRAKPQARIYWFVGSIFVAILMLGLLRGVVAVAVILVALSLLKTENNSPLRDIGSAFGKMFTTGLGVAALGLYALFGIGGLYWLWMAIQYKSFWMFAVGLFPLTAVFAAPVGGYSLIFGPPEWLLHLFAR